MQKNNGFALAITILIALAVIVAGSGAFYYYEKTQAEKEYNQTEIIRANKDQSEVITEETHQDKQPISTGLTDDVSNLDASNTQKAQDTIGYIKLLYPNGKEELQQGKSYRIDWEQDGLEKWGNKVTICLAGLTEEEFSVSNNSTGDCFLYNPHTYQVGEAELGKGSYLWTIPEDIFDKFEQPPSFFLIALAVIDHRPSYEAQSEWAEFIAGDESDKPFRIISDSYINEEYGYEIKYPLRQIIKIIQEEKTTFFGFDRCLAISAEENPQNLDVKAYYQEKYQDYTEEECRAATNFCDCLEFGDNLSKRNLNGKEAFICNNVPGLLLSTTALVSANNFIFQISKVQNDYDGYQGPCDASYVDELFEAILSGIRFFYPAI